MTERALLASDQPPATERSWLDRLEAGDQVILQEHGCDAIALVYERLSSGRIVVIGSGATREFTCDGRLRTPGTYSSTILAEPTPYRKDRIERRHIVRYLAAQSWQHVPLDTLRMIAALVQND